MHEKQDCLAHELLDNFRFDTKILCRINHCPMDWTTHKTKHYPLPAQKDSTHWLEPYFPAYGMTGPQKQSYFQMRRQIAQKNDRPYFLAIRLRVWNVL